MAASNRTLMGQYAGLVSRGAALILDIIIVSISIIIINWVISLPVTYFFNFDLASCGAQTAPIQGLAFVFCTGVNFLWLIVTLFTAPIYFAVLMSIAGQTVGKYVMGVRVVRMDGERMTVPISFIRWLGYFISAIPLGLGFWMVTVDRERRTLHDRLTGTCVIYAWHARQNEFLLDRVYRWFAKGKPMEVRPPMPKLGSAYDIVALAVPNYSGLRLMLNLLQGAVDREEIVVVNTAVLAKDTYGDLGVVGISDLAVGSESLGMIDVGLNIHASRLKEIENDMPGDSFIILVLVKDEFAPMITAMLSKRSPALIRVYDVGDHPETLTAPDGSPLKQAPSPVGTAPH